VTSAYTFAYTLAAGFAYALLYAQFVHSALENEGWGVQLFYEGTCCLAWSFLIEEEGQGCCLCLLNFQCEWECMWVYVCIYADTHTHCTYGVLGFEPRGRDETPRGPEESSIWT